MKIIFLITLVFGLSLVVPAQRKAAAKPASYKDCEPSLTVKELRSFLRGQTIEKINASGSGGQLENWEFEPNELLEIDIIETTLTPKTAVSVIEIKTSFAPDIIRKTGELFDDATILEGRLRLNFELIAGEWTLLKIENLSVKWHHVPIEIQATGTDN